MARGRRLTPMRRGERSPSRLVPMLTILLLAILTVLPLSVPGYAQVTPLLVLAAVYYWTIYQPDLMPPTALFCGGLALDLLTGGPLGVFPLLLLLARAILAPQRRFFIDRFFPFVWFGFAGVAAGGIAFLWLLGSLLAGGTIDPRPAVLQWVLTVAIFPPIAFLLMRVQRAWLPAAV